MNTGSPFRPDYNHEISPLLHMNDVILIPREKWIIGDNNQTTPISDFLLGTSEDDVVHGLLLNDTIEGGDGNDFLYGEQGNDSIKGQNGNDRIFGELASNPNLDIGHDTLDGGTGDDFISAGNGNDVIYGGSGVDTILGDDGADYIESGEDNDLILGLSFEKFANPSLITSEGDVINAGSESDQVYSGGASAVYGNSGSDRIISAGKNIGAVNALGRDTIHGGGENDLLLIYSDNSVAYGEGGNDKFLSDGKGNTVTFGESTGAVIFMEGSETRITDYNSKHFLSFAMQTEGYSYRDSTNGLELVFPKYSHFDPLATGASVSYGTYGEGDAGAVGNYTLLTVVGRSDPNITTKVKIDGIWEVHDFDGNPDNNLNFFNEPQLEFPGGFFITG